MEQKTALTDTDYIWYACYGSNINRERFMRYIVRCGDTTPPVADRPFVFPHSIYFAKFTSLWNGGKGFLDDTQPGKAYGRIYKITRSQFEDVKRMEGSDYRKLLELGTVSGLPVYSFTDRQRNFPDKIPSLSYFQTILDGLYDCYEGIVEKEALARYLVGKALPGHAFAVVRAIREHPHSMTNAEIRDRTGLSLEEVTGAVAWLVQEQLIRQHRRSILAGNSLTDAEALFFTNQQEDVQTWLKVMLEAMT